MERTYKARKKAAEESQNKKKNKQTNDSPGFIVLQTQFAFFFRLSKETSPSWGGNLFARNPLHFLDKKKRG